MPTDIDVQHDGHVDIITINRPEIRNALRFQTYDELEAAVRDVAGPGHRHHRRRPGVLLGRRRPRGDGRRRAARQAGHLDAAPDAGRRRHPAHRTSR